jgi:endoglycosylceramidase
MRQHGKSRLGNLIIGLILLAAVMQFPSLINASPDTGPAGFLRADGAHIVDAQGQTILLRGVNFRGYHYLQLSQMETAHSENDFKNFKAWGFNVVRLLISWQGIEPTKGMYSEAYLEYVDRDIAWARKYGIYVILDMHQNYWNRKWGGNGVPDWVVAQYNSTDEGRFMAVEDFWKDAEQQLSFVKMWQYVAARYANETIIAGYDLLNEPWHLYDKRTTTLDQLWPKVEALYRTTMGAIRAADSNHMIFVETALPYLTTPINVPNLVWSIHFYYYPADVYGQPYSSDNRTLLEDYLRGFYDKLVLGFQQPMWIGEFGLEMSIKGSDMWTRDTTQLFSTYQLGWSWWAYWRSAKGSNDMYLLTFDGTPREYFLRFLAHPQTTLSQ